VGVLGTETPHHFPEFLPCPAEVSLLAALVQHPLLGCWFSSRKLRGKLQAVCVVHSQSATTAVHSKDSLEGLVDHRLEDYRRSHYQRYTLTTPTFHMTCTSEGMTPTSQYIQETQSAPLPT